LKIINKSTSIKNIVEITDYSMSSVKIRVESLVSKGLIDYDIEATKKLGKEFVIITEKGVKTAKRIDEIINKKKISENPAPNKGCS